MMEKKIEITADFATAVLRRYFDTQPEFVEQIHGGLANYVFEAKLGKKELVLRLSQDPCRLPVYMKEQWAVKKAREHNVPVPEILEVGNEIDGIPYMIAEKVLGESANECSNRLPILRELGGYARRINSIATSNFGHIFDWSRNQLTRNETWSEFLDNELRVGERIESFRALGVFSEVKLQQLQRSVEQLRKISARPALTHGDLRLKNVLLDQDHRIKAIIDWDNCSGNAAPFWEFSIALHDLNIDEKEAFLEGYGISPKEFLQIAPLAKTLNILNYYGAIQECAGDGNNSSAQFLKARLNGAFDLYSL